MVSRKDQRKKRKKKSWLKWTLLIVLILFLMIVGYGVYFFTNVYNASKDSYQGLDRPGEKSALRDKDVSIGKDPISFLIEGIEDYSTGDTNGRADALIVATLNPDTDKMTMVSIPRDTRVELNQIKGEEGWHKINSAHAYGESSDYGANKLQVETVENLLDVPIDKYVAVDFSGFKKIVDTLGGVTVDVKYPFWEKNHFDNDRHIQFEKGKKHMNGEEGLAFVRMRKRAVNAQYSRDERQRQFLKATLNEAISAGTIFKVDDVSDILGKHVKTNLSPKEIYGLERAYSSMDTSSIETLHIDGQDQMIEGLSYFTPDPDSLDEVSNKLKHSLGLSKFDDKDTSTKASQRSEAKGEQE